MRAIFIRNIFNVHWKLSGEIRAYMCLAVTRPDINRLIISMSKLYYHYMQTMKRISVSICFFLFTLSFISAESKPGRYSLSISPLTSVIYGQAEELVYKYPDEKQYKSQLLWDLKPLAYVGFGLDLAPKHYFFEKGAILSASVKYGLPLNTGIHENRDWMSDDGDWLTHYSRHDLYSFNSMLVDFSAGYSWILQDFVSIGMYGAFSFISHLWSGENGFLQYPKNSLGEYLYEDAPEWTDSIRKENVYGIIIYYSQNWFILSPGIFMKAMVSPRFSIESNIEYSPLIFCIARDDHLLGMNTRSRGATYWDYLYFGHFINWDNKLVISPADKLDIFLSVSCRFITDIRGRTYSQDTGANVSGLTVLASTNGAGAKYSVIDIKLGTRIRIYN